MASDLELDPRELISTIRHAVESVEDPAELQVAVSEQFSQLRPVQKQALKRYISYCNRWNHISLDNQSFMLPERLVDYLKAKAPEQMASTKYVAVHFARSTTTPFSTEHNCQCVAYIPSLIEFVKSDKQKNIHQSFYPMNDFRANHKDLQPRVVCCFGGIIQQVPESNVCTLYIDLVYPKRKYKVEPSTLNAKTQELILEKVATEPSINSVNWSQYRVIKTINARIKQIIEDLDQQK